MTVGKGEAGAAVVIAGGIIVDRVTRPGIHGEKSVVNGVFLFIHEDPGIAWAGTGYFLHFHEIPKARLFLRAHVVVHGYAAHAGQGCTGEPHDAPVRRTMIYRRIFRSEEHTSELQ